MPAMTSVPTPAPPSAPALSTSAVATPSGNCSGWSMISARRSGIVNSTPSRPPKPAISVVSTYENCSQIALPSSPLSITSAGRVKITPAARPSPDAAAVCTPLFWWLLPVRSRRKIAIEITAAGTDADTVMPANMPRYAFAPARMTDSSEPSSSTPSVSSGSDFDAGMYGSTWPPGCSAMRGI